MKARLKQIQLPGTSGFSQKAPYGQFKQVSHISFWYISFHPPYLKDSSHWLKKEKPRRSLLQRGFPFRKNN